MLQWSLGLVNYFRAGAVCIRKPISSYSQLLPLSFNMTWNRETSWTEAIDVAVADELWILEWLVFLK